MTITYNPNSKNVLIVYDRFNPYFKDLTSKIRILGYNTFSIDTRKDFLENFENKDLDFKKVIINNNLRELNAIEYRKKFDIVAQKFPIYREIKIEAAMNDMNPLIENEGLKTAEELVFSYNLTSQMIGIYSDLRFFAKKKLRDICNEKGFMYLQKKDWKNLEDFLSEDVKIDTSVKILSSILIGAYQ